MKKYLLISIIAMALLSTGLFSLVFYDFLAVKAAHVPLAKRAGGRVEAIVVLTGGRGRIKEGMRLFAEQRGGVLILSGVNARADLKSIFPGGLARGLPERIILEKKSKNTYENAVEVEKILLTRGYGSIILVTSHYHMKRALFVFRSIISSGITIEASGVSSPNYDDKRPLAGKNLSINISEFMKFYWFKARLTVWS